LSVDGTGVVRSEVSVVGPGVVRSVVSVVGPEVVRPEAGVVEGKLVESFGRLNVILSNRIKASISIPRSKFMLS
jgi:hypothetical protein